MATEFSATDWQYYDVSATTLRDAASAIAHLPEAGSTEWFPAFSYESDEHGNVSSATVTVATRVTLPNWSGVSSAGQAEQDEWNRFLAALVAHENGHLELVTAHFTDVDQHMIGGAPHHAQSVFDHALHSLHAASQAYDSQTDHGRHAGTIIDVDVGA